MLTLKWTPGTDWLFVEGADQRLKFAVTNKVRIRSKDNREDVVRTMPGGVPYMPVGFPRGTWKVTGIRPKSDPYTAPYFIATDARNMVPEWGLDVDGSYGSPTGRLVRDEGYGIHHSTSSTTLGCLKIDNKSDLLTLVQLINARMAMGETVTLIVG
jgi:hypothetical protein